MRIRPTSATTFGRKAGTATALAALVGGGALLTGGTASATTAVADGCTGSLSGAMGTPVAITGASVQELVKRGANEAGTLAVGDWAASDIAKVPTIEIGQVPEAASGSIDGDVVGTAVRGAVEDTGTLGLGLDRGATLDNIEHKVAGSCGLTVQASDYQAPQPQPQPSPQPEPGAPVPPPNTPTPELTSALPAGGGTGDARAPRRDYSNIPTATPGNAPPPSVRYPEGNPIPGMQAPQFDVLDQQNAGAAPQPGPGSEVRNAGNADSLAAPDASTKTVQLPMLFAVVALAGVTAALVRTWVLRRT